MILTLKDVSILFLASSLLREIIQLLNKFLTLPLHIQGKEEHRKAACDALVMVYTTLKDSSSMNSDELCPKLINMVSTLQELLYQFSPLVVHQMINWNPWFFR